MPPIRKKVYALSLGCAKNQVDSEKALAEILSANFENTDSPEKCDLLLINTCGFIESAKEESIDAILSLLEHKSDRQKVVVFGCLSKRYGGELSKAIQEVDLWLGTYQSGIFLKSLENLGLIGTHRVCNSHLSFRATNGRPYKPGRANLSPTTRLPPPVLLRKRDTAFRHHAYLKIAEGCNRACAFCAIPLIRGKQVSSSINDLAEEARQLEKSGVKELTLVAQDLSSYGLDLHNSANLTSLLENLLKKTKIPWIRLMYLYPEHITDDLLNLMATESRICKYIDMPIQHASDKILKLMRRKGTQKDLRNLIEKMRVKVSEISLRTTLLLGFPGETHEDFEELMKFADDIQFEHLGAFIWSPEEGTSAIKLKQERVPEDVARLRLNALTERAEEISLEKNEQLIGKTVEVILDSVADESEFHFYGRTRGDAFEVDNVVRILEGNGSLGKICKVKIVDAKEHEIDGVIL